MTGYLLTDEVDQLAEWADGDVWSRMNPQRELVHAIETGELDVDPLVMIAVTGTAAWPRWREQLAHMIEPEAGR
ncbi:MAG: hypothetical protein R2695_04060 [Acidimicrobiales bacterium]